MEIPGSPASYANMVFEVSSAPTAAPKSAGVPYGVCPPGYSYPPQLGTTPVAAVPIPGYFSFNYSSGWTPSQGPLML